jgi:hypothetical protein
MLAGNDPQATGRINVVPAHPPDPIAALPCHRKEPHDCAELSNESKNAPLLLETRHAPAARRNRFAAAD